MSPPNAIPGFKWSTPSAPLVAACVGLTVLCLLLSAFILYIFCSKKYRLNWYERNLLEAQRHKDLAETEGLASVEERSAGEGGDDVEQDKTHKDNLRKLFSIRHKSLSSSLGNAIGSILPSVNSRVRKSSSNPDRAACFQDGADSIESAGSLEGVVSEGAASDDVAEATSWQACVTAKRQKDDCRNGVPLTAIQAIDPGKTAAAHDVVGKFWVPEEFKRQSSELSLRSKSTKNKSVDSSGGEDEFSDAHGASSMHSADTLASGTSVPVASGVGGGVGGSGGGRTCSDVVAVGCGTRAKTKAPSLGSKSMKGATGKIDPNIYKDEASGASHAEEVDLGSVHVVLKFEAETNVLTVKLLEAQGLVPRDFSGTASPYCRLALLPGRRPQLQSRTRRGTTDPAWEEEFAFDVAAADIHTKTLEILVYDYDQYSRDECIGQATIPLGGVDFSSKVDVWKALALQDRGASFEKQKRVKGDVMFSLAYLPSAERLTVVVMKARNLKPIEEEKPSADPYVKVSLSFAGKRLKKKKTSTKTNTLNPAFNEALVFQLGKEFLPNVCLEVAVIDNALLGQKQMIGRIELGPEALGDEREHWQDMVNAKSAIARWHSVY